MDESYINHKTGDFHPAAAVVSIVKAYHISGSQYGFNIFIDKQNRVDIIWNNCFV